MNYIVTYKYGIKYIKTDITCWLQIWCTWNVHL